MVFRERGAISADRREDRGAQEECDEKKNAQ